MKTGTMCFSKALEFEVADYRILEDNEENPLANVPVPTNQTEPFGRFENNPWHGFNYSVVSASSDNWGRTASLELYSPLKSEEEDRIFTSEIGSTELGGITMTPSFTSLQLLR